LVGGKVLDLNPRIAVRQSKELARVVPAVHLLSVPFLDGDFLVALNRLALGQLVERGAFDVGLSGLGLDERLYLDLCFDLVNLGVS
jgi:hypothetical protein